MTMLMTAPELLESWERQATQPVAPAARAVDAVKVHGRGNTSVRALDGVTVEFEQNRFTAIMGPSGSGKSTLLHCLAGLDTLTSGHVYVGRQDLGSLSERALTRLRRDRLGFIFQAYNLLPTLTAAENITLPLALAGRRPTRPGSTWSSTWSGWRIDSGTARPNCPAASSCGWLRPGRWSPGPRSSSPTSRRETSTRGRAPPCWRSCARRSTTSARRSSWSPTTRWPRPTPTGSCSWPTAEWSTRCWNRMASGPSGT